MSILEQLGTTAAAYEEAKGSSVTATFEPLASGAYKATVKSVMVYVNRFGGTQMKYIVNLTDSDRDIEFRQDIGATLKAEKEGEVGAPNLGYASRLKQFAFASGVELDALTLDSVKTKHKIFGTDQEVTLIKGMVGKPVLALVRLSDDTNKAEGESYKISNDLEGVCAMNGIDASGEDAKAIFLAKVEKNPVFKYKGKQKSGTATANTGMTTEAKAAASSLI